MLPPRPTRRRLQRSHDLEAATGLQHPLPTLRTRRCRRPRKARFRLAGWPLLGGGRTLWIATKAFRAFSRRPPFQGLPCRKLGACRAPRAQARHLHGSPAQDAAVPASADLVVLPRPQSLPTRADPATKERTTRAVRSPFWAPDRLRRAGPAARAVARQQVRTPAGARPPRYPATHQRIRERHQGPGDPAQGQRRNPQRHGPGLPGCVLEPDENLPEARSVVLELPGHQARRPRPARHSIPARPRPNSLQASLTASGFANIASDTTKSLIFLTRVACVACVGVFCALVRDGATPLRLDRSHPLLSRPKKKRHKRHKRHRPFSSST